MLLNREDHFKEYIFSESEFEIYLHNNFHTFTQIDSWSESKTGKGERNMIDINVYEPDIVSNKEELIRSVLNSKVKQLIRYGLEPKEDFPKEYGLDEKMAFSLSEGSLVIEFENGTSLGFNSDEEICSVIIWAERYERQYKPEQLRSAEDLFPIKADDMKYSTEFFANLINKTLIGFEIIKLEPYSPIYYALPREVGLVLIFSNNSQMIISHQLTKQVSHDFTVLDWKQVDKTDVYERLYKSSRFWGDIRGEIIY